MYVDYTGSRRFVTSPSIKYPRPRAGLKVSRQGLMAHFSLWKAWPTRSAGSRLAECSPSISFPHSTAPPAQSQPGRMRNGGLQNSLPATLGGRFRNRSAQRQPGRRELPNKIHIYGKRFRRSLPAPRSGSSEVGAQGEEDACLTVLFR